MNHAKYGGRCLRVTHIFPDFSLPQVTFAFAGVIRIGNCDVLWNPHMPIILKPDGGSNGEL